MRFTLDFFPFYINYLYKLTTFLTPLFLIVFDATFFKSGIRRLQSEYVRCDTMDTVSYHDVWPY